MSHDSVVLITGATGFIGSHLLQRFLSEGYSVIALTSGENNKWRLPQDQTRLTVRQADIADENAVASVFTELRPDLVYHLAAGGVRADVEGGDTTFGVNVVATLGLARAALRHGVERFIHIGSGFELRAAAVPLDESAKIGSTNYYGATKAAATVLLEYLERVEELPLVICRPFSVYGPGENPGRFVPYVIRQALRGEAMELTMGTQMRDYLFVADLVDGLFRAKNAPIGSCFHFGAGPQGAYSIRSVVETILRLTGAPADLALWGKRTPPRPEPQYFVADTSEAQNRLRWQAKTLLEDGLTQTIQYYRDNQTG
ncbi:MAG: NAD(P)-dependent oxidoreductase [Fibrella sp.]|nr:NAD(P)-dependent oxidoreductase [Armatimonadota bacterium]